MLVPLPKCHFFRSSFNSHPLCFICYCNYAKIYFFSLLFTFSSHFHSFDFIFCLLLLFDDPESFFLFFSFLSQLSDKKRKMFFFLQWLVKNIMKRLVKISSCTDWIHGIVRIKKIEEKTQRHIYIYYMFNISIMIREMVRFIMNGSSGDVYGVIHELRILLF